MKNLPVQSLQIEEIKNNFKDFLRGNEKYKDFNFEASGISTLLNIQSYQTHYLGFFVKMLLDESFVDSAHTRQAMLSHAKRNGYTPKGKKSSTAEVVLKVNTTLAQEPLSRSIYVPRGATFSAVNNAQDKRTFTVLDGAVLHTRIVDGSSVQYVSDPLAIYEGNINTWNFVVDDGIINQRFVIRDPLIDIDTLRVRVRENPGSAESQEYKLARGVTDLDPSSTVFFVSTDENGNYQVFFGGNQVGVQPANGNAIEVTFIAANGVSGDGAKVFDFNAPAPGSGGNIGNYSDFDVDTLSPSAGGAEPQTTEELRFAIPNHYRRQERAVNSADYRSILLDEFRNIDSLNVWGGEDNNRRDYGKVYISIKPKNSDKLTALARTQIKDSIIKQYGVVGIDVVFVDPEFIDVDLTVKINVDLRKTNRSLPEVNQLVRDRINTYNTTYLSKFDNMLSDVDMLQFIREGEDEFVTLYDTKILNKNTKHLYGTTSSVEVFFGNQLTPNTVTSSDVLYAGFTAYIKDDGQGKLGLFNRANNQRLASAGTVDYATGTILYNLPSTSRTVGFETGASGVLTFSAVPVVPDVNTYLNNIVRIASVRVVNG